MDQKGEQSKINFDYFQIQKWMLQTVRAEKLDEKNGVIYLVCMFPFELWSLNFPKSAFFAILCWPQQILLKQFTYVHLKVLITLFQQMVWLIGVWATFMRY